MTEPAEDDERRRAWVHASSMSLLALSARASEMNVRRRVSRASDLPTVSTMVVLYGVVLVLVGLALSLVRARRYEP